jgi:hypothetical protein
MHYHGIHLPVACCLLGCVDAVFVTNPSESWGADKILCFSLNEQLVNLWIARNCQGSFEQYAFVMKNLIKHADAKAYNRHVVTGMMKLGELILVGQEGSSGIVAFGKLLGTMGATCECFERWPTNQSP